MLPPPGRPRGSRGSRVPGEPDPPETKPIPIADPLPPIVSPHPGPPTVPAPAPIRRRSRSAQGALLPAQRLVTPADEAAFAVIEAEMGGRGKLVATLATAALDEQTSLAVGLIADPRNDQESLAKVCAMGGISLGQIMKIFRAAVLSRGQMIAITRIAEKVPDVAAAVMEDALPGDRVCPKCLGATVLPHPTKDDPAATERCPTCYGVGTVRHEPDHDVQKTALQLAGLLDKGGGVKVTQIVANQNHGGGTDSASFDTLIGALDQVIYGSGRDRMRQAPEREEPSDNPVEGEILNG